ncbi:MAG: PD40 domain-containing protein [Calditrichaceae bacterium]|nr:PD40 domain-containing protein [Calditrichaceae bacterium]MBN2709559.1 PD40 domain-containing protein [Calditrichaceae bacterium]RQV93541.1 MAG: hypothetical protein EH224_12310 [Calditrichota bacterium]
MKRSIFILFFIPLMHLSLFGAESHLMRYADVSETHIVFTYEGDLWLAPIAGGLAKRITSDEGSEMFAKFSPDGQMIAYTANYDGGTDVYVMNRDGGVPKRLTYHPAENLVLDWYPDGKHILFRSSREWPFRADMLYKISINGGMPEKLPVDRAGLASLSPDASMLAYNRISREFRTWKRHQGGTAQDIWIGSLAKSDFKPVTDFKGTDNFPMWVGDAVYFTSDRNDGTLNLFKYDVKSGEVSALTNYKDYDVKYPSAGPNHIIYQNEETLNLLSLTGGKAEPVKIIIEIPTENLSVREAYIDAAKFPRAFGLSPSGKRAVFDMRGEIISIPVEEGIIYNLSQSPGSREKNPAWSPDGTKIVFLSDRSGEEELWLVNPEGGEWRQLTKGNKGFRAQPVWSPDSRYLIFHDKFMKLNLVDAANGNISVIDQGEFDDAWERWGIQDYVWSPDSRWIAYSKMELSMYESIFLYSIDHKKTYRVTSDMTQDWSPSFSPDGLYLYFLSNRTFNPVMGFVDQNHIFLDMTKPYILILNEGDPSPFIPKNEKEGAEEPEKPDRSKSLKITLKNFEDRLIEGPVSAGNLFRLEAVDGGFLYLKKTENEFLKYQTVTDDNGSKNLDLYKFDLKKKTAEAVMTGISQYHLSADGKKMIYKAGSLFGIVDAGVKAASGDGKIDLNAVKIKTDKLAEFNQMFNEAWRIQRDWFYDKNMHGLNWQKTGNKYRKFIPFCGNRQDLNYLIGEMIAELNVGHTYVYGGDYQRPKRISTGLLGAEFVLESEKSYPKIARIINGNSWDERAMSPFEEPGCPVKTGDYILAIDGVAIGPGDDIYKYLENKAGQVVELTYNSKPVFTDAKKHLVKTLTSEYTLRYEEWSRNNLQYVWEKTAGQVGYVHLPGMMENGLIEFAKAFYPQYRKQGMIIDARYNGGGFTSKQIHDRLERQVNSIIQPREGKPGVVPERTFNGHYVLIINRDTGSDGEIFSEAWKYRKIGPIVGERTWGGAVGIEAHQDLMDGGGVTPPQFGEYDFSSQWIIEGHGVEPDIVVVNMPADVLKGIDTQLDKAIDIILERIKKDPKAYPMPPEYPDKSKPSLK